MNLNFSREKKNKIKKKKNGKKKRVQINSKLWFFSLENKKVNSEFVRNIAEQQNGTWYHGTASFWGQGVCSRVFLVDPNPKAVSFINMVQFF